MKKTQRQPHAFTFKQFTVQHDQSTLKVCTDSCLFGAWANPASSQRILDVGTGSGLLALMLAQRSPSTTSIDAIDIHAASVQQARYNVQQSPFSGQIQVHLSFLQDWKPNYQYDYIICNPPFWENSLKRQNTVQNVAMHSTQLTSSDLLQHASRLLLPTGVLGCMYPPTEMKVFENQAIASGWHVSRTCQVYDKLNGKLIRVLSEFCLQSVSFLSADVVFIRDLDGSYSRLFSFLLFDYYLIF